MNWLMPFNFIKINQIVNPFCKAVDESRFAERMQKEFGKTTI